MGKILVLFILIISTSLEVFSQDKSDVFDAYITPDTAVAGEASSMSIIIKCKKVIKANTLFKIKFVKGFVDFQKFSAVGVGFVKASMNTNGGVVSVNSIKSSFDENLSYWEMNVLDRVITIITRNVDMAIGDSITVAIGQGGLFSKTIAPNTAYKDVVEIAMSDNGATSNVTLTTISPVFEVKARPAKAIYLFASSVAKEGQESKLLVTTADEYFNIDEHFVGEIALSSNNSSDVILPAKVILSPQDSGRKEVPVYFLNEGNYNISGRYLDGEVPVLTSNPIRVNRDSNFIYWGDLHSHGATSRDGYGRGRYKYARYARGLDFFCATDHADHGKTIYGISDREWARQKSEVLANHEEGKFIPFIGYENSFLYPIGHYNLIFNVKDENIDQVPMWPMRVVNDIQTVWSLAQQQNIDLLTIPHHCGKVFNQGLEGDSCKNCNTFGGNFYNETYKRLIEIYSYHGLSESYDPSHNLAYYNRSNISKSFDGPNYAQDAWAIGEKLGVIASSDDHTGHPGSIVNGVVAVYASELERDTLFQALKNRHSYGTTGERIWVDFRVNNALMGSTIEILEESKPEISFDIMGTDSIDYVEVLKWDFNRGVYENGHPKFEVLAHYNTDISNPKNLKKAFVDNGFTDSCLYYLRVKQKNVNIDYLKAKEIWAWTSPVWVSHLIENNTTDSLKSYQPKMDGKRVRHLWTMYRNQGVNQYVIEKKTQEGDWDELFSYTPNDPYQLEFEYVELYPNNGTNVYRLKYTNTANEVKYSPEAEVFLQLDSLLHFSHSLENGQIILHWDVAKELHTNSYNIEDERNSVFENIGNILAQIDLGDTVHSYSWNTQISESGIYRFRLSQVIENQIPDTLLLTVEIVSTGLNNQNIANEFVIKNNLLSNVQILEYKASEKLLGSQISIINMDGHIVKDLGNLRNKDTWNSVALSDFAPSTYRMVVKTTQGQIFTFPFVVVY